MRGHKVYWSDAEIEIINANYKTMIKKDICKLIYEKLGITKTYTDMKNYYAYHGLTSGINTNFKKGGVSWNKGKKMSAETYAKVSKTFIPKGNRPHNALEVGTERFVYDHRLKKGYWYVKIAEPREWKLKHHILWESVNGTIPDGYYVTFLDGDTNNITIENLRLIHKKDNAVVNHMYGNVELTSEERDIVIDIATLSRKIKDRES